uniref:Uncharacterized protein n=1 Tax=Lactuca sativa TaxID=4236 RepID=A0A9R1VG73_LACSA|nr:hypothetical protein LSAT_V11C500270430 [Lactuca sativa]
MILTLQSSNEQELCEDLSGSFDRRGSQICHSTHGRGMKPYENPWLEVRDLLGKVISGEGKSPPEASIYLKLSTIQKKVLNCYFAAVIDIASKKGLQVKALFYILRQYLKSLCFLLNPLICNVIMKLSLILTFVCRDCFLQHSPTVRTHLNVFFAKIQLTLSYAFSFFM